MAQSEAPLERRLWLACAPPLTRVPDIGALTYYLPRGHASQCDGTAPTGQAADDKYLCVVRSVDLLVRGDDVYARIGLAPVDGAGFLAGHARRGKDDDVVRLLRDSVNVGDNEAIDVRDLKDAVGLRAHSDHHRKDSQDVRDHARCERNCGNVVSGYTRRGKDDDVARDHARQDKVSVGVCDHARRDLKDGSVVLDHARCDLKRTVVVPDSGSVRADHALLDAKARDLKDGSVVLDHARGDLKHTVVEPDHARCASHPLFDDSGSVRDLVADHALLDAKARVHQVPEPEHAGIDDNGPRPPSANILLIFPKLLTASDVNVSHGAGSFHLPKACVTRILPPLYDVAGQVEPPKQTLQMLDLEGAAFSFNHSHTGVPTGRRHHLFTSGWKTLVNTKRAEKGDIVLFMSYGEELRISLQRAAMPAAFVHANEVAHATRLASKGMAFDVVWCPRRGAEFVLPLQEVEEALRINWMPGMRVSCRTGMVRPGVPHRDLPHKIGIKEGTVRTVQNHSWQKLEVQWDDEQPSSSGTTTASSMRNQYSIRLFGVDIFPCP